VGDIAPIIGAVGDVTIDKEIRLPFVPQTNPRACFGSVGFHVVAIEILISAGRAPTHLRWSILIDAVVWSCSFVTVGVVNRDEEQHDVRQYACDAFRDRDVAQQSESGVFTVRFTGVNAGLNEYDGFTFGVRGLSREGARFGGDDQW